jgi:hypothetical protein
MESQRLPGYVEACESWQKAYWRWVDKTAPFPLVDAVARFEIDWSQIDATRIPRAPTSDDEQKPWWSEQLRQESLQRTALFELAMKGPEASDPETYKLFFPDFQLAEQIGVNWYFELIARQKQRKPTKDKGDRRLAPQLLLLWIPGCLWAVTWDGMAQFLQTWYPRSQGGLGKDQGGHYHTKHISDMCHEVGLIRAPKPHWREISGDPPQQYRSGKPGA